MKCFTRITACFMVLFLVSFKGVAVNPDKQISVQENLREYVDKLEKLRTIRIDGEKILGNSVLISLYKDNDFKLLWKSEKNRNDLLDIIEASYFEGLNPKDYHSDYIKSYLQELAEGEKTETKEIAAFDIILSNALLTYAHHMVQGKVDPTLLDPNWNYSQKVIPDDAEFRIAHALKTHTLKKEAIEIRPQIRMYTKYLASFAKYDSIQKVNGNIQQIPYPGKALRLGDSLQVVGELKRHLSHFNNTLHTSNSNVFDEDLEAQLISFQKENRLEADGIAGKNTFSMLNLSAADRLDILRVNMERCRWMNNNLPADFLLVNIADFNLFLYRNHKIDYQCKVVVGKEYHETPIFSSEIKYLVFNPTWTIPYSIASKESLPKLKADPQYLKKNNMTLLRGNKVVDPSTVDFKSYTRRNFPYTIRQEPGANNALGLVKFIFPNKYAVYLHDTPSKSFFNKTERAYSHGCVRVQNPLVLAEQLLQKQGYNTEKIDTIIKSEKQQHVNLDEFMPVHLMYWTCIENSENGEMYFRKDIYKRDKAVLKSLNDKR